MQIDVYKRQVNGFMLIQIGSLLSDAVSYDSLIGQSLFPRATSQTDTLARPFGDCREVFDC